MTSIKPYLRAVVQGAVTLAAYLIGVLPAAGGPEDLTFVQWLGAFVFVATSFGITQSAYKAVPPAPIEKD